MILIYLTLETLVNNPLNPDELSYNTEANENFKKMTIEEFTKISQSECGSSRGRSEEVGGGGDG